MSDKLEALSQPVGYYRLAEDGISHYLSSPTKKLDDAVVPLYSQEYVDSLLAALEEKDKKEGWLKEQLAGLANFNPDWDMLRAAQNSLREHIALIKEKDRRIEELENDEVRQRLANAEHQIYMADLAKHNLRASRKAQFRKRREAERKLAALPADWSKDSSLETWFPWTAVQLEELQPRIAELERANAAQDDHINQQQDRIDTLEKKNDELGKHIGKLEQRLQQPIKLPNKNDDEFWFGSTFQVAKFDRAVERAIIAAGFKFKGE